MEIDYDPFVFDGLQFTKTVEESKQLNEIAEPLHYHICKRHGRCGKNKTPHR